MTTTPQTKTSTNNPITAVLFYGVTIVLLPIFCIGYVVWIGAMFTRRKSSASATAQAPLFARWLEHHMGTRPDEGANKMLPVAPGIPSLGWRLVGGTQLVAHRLSGYVPVTLRYPFEGEVTIQNQGGARQTFYDRVVQRFIPPVGQFVILGAGYDTRALNLPKSLPVRSFEVDTPATIAGKRETLAKAGMDANAVAFVAADFEHEDWLQKLVEAGFDVSRPALFICEGVTPYLDQQAVEDTLRKIAGLAPGTVVAFDHFTSEVLQSNSLTMRSIRASLSAGGEPLKFGIAATPPLKNQVVALLGSCGLELIEQRTLGDETGGKRAWGGFVMAGVRSGGSGPGGRA
jgi:methyltransferase (TIGR00027 family)